MLRACLVLILLVLSSLTMAARLQSIEIKEHDGRLSLAFNLDTPIAHKVFTLTHPDRVVVDFEDTNLIYNLDQLKLNNHLIKRVRSGRPNPKTLRLVFEVTDAVMFRANPWGKGQKAAHIFSLDLSAATIAHVNQKLIKQKNPISAPIVRTIPRTPLRDVVIVLDPGHGGKDPGAQGPKRSWEKNVTLKIATRLKEIIDKQPGMRAVLTRKGDYYVGLRERLNIARKYNADVFISIHADAFINQQSNGASVFALSQRGATSEAARWLAEKENYSELGGVNLADLDDQTGLVRTVLIDLSQTATIGASLHMGERVLRNLNSITRLHNERVEQARFMVLKSPDIPSILVETGFISNPREETNLNSPNYQTKLTQAIFAGLKNYFWEYPLHGTQIEAMVNQQEGRMAVKSVMPIKTTVPQHRIAASANTHLVRTGESMPMIAAKYRVSIAAILAVNHLNDTHIRPGQKLTIPPKIS